ncbi:MAG: GNAT family N-acetyltransferase [Phreatobacter sp.]|uniref:GNAT family N-acetyltransferase n=1 Tax=Phreatobacter sp. TaxID=1966341 RepID=UPI001A485130|nr:GNAT family N-acetyltransferase [Phreatobacter sp.]MBL8569956.1 GNAT family N-acetyltransferase [Phreatobacter sp.]
MAEVVLRTVGPADASLFARIAPDVFDGPVAPERLAAYLASPEHLMVLAVSDDVIVGQVAGVVHRHPDLPTELYIDNLGVTPALRRQGVGRRLVEAVMALGRERGCSEAWVGTEPDNLPARALYRALRPTEEETFAFYLYDL